jgi:ribonuclease M5
MRRRVREVIIVEGRYDRAAVLACVDGTVLETSGFGIFNDAEKLGLFRLLADKRGLIILTDSDGAGFMIRGKLRGMIDPSNVKNAYIPDVPGCERRKRASSKEGKLGVEGMSRDVLLTALERAGATFEDDRGPVGSCEPITKYDLYVLGFSGGPHSAEKRRALLAGLGLPERLPPNSIPGVLSALFSRREFFEYCASLPTVPSATIENEIFFL